MALSIGPGWSIGGNWTVGVPATTQNYGAMVFDYQSSPSLYGLFQTTTPNTVPNRPSDYTGNITIEAWIKPTSANANASIVWAMQTDTVQSGSDVTSRKLQCVQDGNQITVQSIPWFNDAPTGGASTFAPVSASVNLDQWNYMCFVFIGNVASLYVNGQLAGSSTNDIAPYFANAFFVGYGSLDGTTITRWDGQVTNFRITGSDVYSLASVPATMLVPTAQLAAISGATMVLLLAATEATAFADSAGGVAGPFQQNLNWAQTNPDPWIVIGAWNFNGANDLQILDFSPQTYTGNTTFEMWVNPTGTSTSPVWWMPVDYVSSTNYNKLQCYLNGSTFTAQSLPSAGGASTFTAISTTLNLNAWNYVCFAVVNGVAILYVNGDRIGSSTASNYTYKLDAWFVGYDTTTNPDQFFSGQLTNIRMSNADIYSLAALPATMTVPTSQLTVQGTTLILYTMSNPTANISNETDSTGNAFTNGYNPPTWFGSNPGPY